MKRLRDLLGWLLVATLAVWAAVYVRDHRDAFAAALDLQPAYLAALAALFLFCLAVRGLLLKASVSAFGIALRPVEWLSISVANAAASYALPFGGIGVRAVYLRQRHGLSLADFTAVLAGCSILLECVHCLIALAALGWIWAIGGGMTGPHASLPAAILGSVAVGGIVVLVWPSRPASGGGGSGGPFGFLRRAMDGWRTLKGSRSALFALAGFTLLDVAAIGVTKWTTFHAVGHPIGVAPAIIFNAMGGLALAVRITPGGLGVTETIQVFTALCLGVPGEVAGTAMIVERVIGTGISFLAAPFATRVLVTAAPPAVTDPARGAPAEAAPPSGPPAPGTSGGSP